MQLLSHTNNRASSHRQCAGALLEVLPGLMRFVRRQMRSRRTKALSVPQFRTLVQLRRCPAASLSRICEALGSTPPTVSRIVSGLVTQGLIARQTSPHDRRQLLLQLTPRGRQVIDRAWAGTREVLAERFLPLSSNQLDGLARSLALLDELFPCHDNEELSASGSS